MTSLFTKGQIKTYSGKYLDIRKPELDTIEIEDIIIGLSNQPRWMGQTNRPFSVLSHSVCVALLTTGNVWEAFMHDASEAYLADIAKPIKELLPDYLKLEEILMNAISEKFGFNYPLSPATKAADDFMLKLEFMLLKNEVKSGIYADIAYQIAISREEINTDNVRLVINLIEGQSKIDVEILKIVFDDKFNYSDSFNSSAIWRTYLLYSIVS